MPTKISIIQAAIIRLGSESAQSTSDDTDTMIAVERLYEPLVRDWLTKHAWSFATRKVTISATNEAADPPWQYVFAMPTDVLNVREVRRAGEQIEYQLQGTRLLAMANAQLVVEHTWRCPEEVWPDDFAAGIQEELLGQLLEAFDEYNRAGERRQNAVRMMRQALRRDRRQFPARKAVRGVGVLAWYNRAPWRA